MTPPNTPGSETPHGNSTMHARAAIAQPHADPVPEAVSPVLLTTVILTLLAGATRAADVPGVTVGRAAGDVQMSASQRLRRDLQKTIDQFTSLAQGPLARIDAHVDEVHAEIEILQRALAELAQNDGQADEKLLTRVRSVLGAARDRSDFLTAEDRVLRAMPGDDVAGIDTGQTAVAVFAVRPLTSKPILPHRPLPEHARYTRELKVTACRGEYEPAGLVVYPFREIPVTLTWSDLAHDGGDGVIAASHVSIKGVKCWYQGGNAWHSNGQDHSTRVLIPELLLNDDALVKVNHGKRVNFLRLDGEDGPRYHSISFTEPRGWPDDVFPQALDLPVRDSPHLLPLDLAARTHKQFMVTVHVPTDAASGRYTGAIELVSHGRVLETMRLKVEVLPFELAQPMRFDLQGTYHSSIYALQVLQGGPGRIHDQHSRSRDQLLAEYRNMKAHGVTNPVNCQLSEVYDLDLFADLLRIRINAGLENRPLFLGALTHPFANVGFRTRSDPESLRALQARVTEIMDVVESVLGHRDVYFYGIDEGKLEELDQQRPLWKAIHEAGGKVFSAGYRPGMNEDEQGAIGRVGDLMDCLISAAGVSRKEADDWHQRGHMVWSYANPQAGRENPHVYRRNFGLEVWRANFDGAANFSYYAALNNPWNDLDYALRDFLFVYPTGDGVVDTLAWEGYREGIDDLRYGTTLKLFIAQARAFGDADQRARAAEAGRFLEAVDLSGDLDAIRARMIEHILALTSNPDE